MNYWIATYPAPVPRKNRLTSGKMAGAAGGGGQQVGRDGRPGQSDLDGPIVPGCAAYDQKQCCRRKQCRRGKQCGYWRESGCRKRCSRQVRLQGNAAPVVPMYRRPFFRIAVAAAIILIISAGARWFMNGSSRDLAKTGGTQGHANDILPGGNKAVLTLANGATVVLDSAANGELAQQGNASIVKTAGGQLAYNILNEKPAEAFYNTLATPRGGQYQLILPGWQQSMAECRLIDPFSRCLYREREESRRSPAKPILKIAKTGSHALQGLYKAPFRGRGGYGSGGARHPFRYQRLPR